MATDRSAYKPLEHNGHEPLAESLKRPRAVPETSNYIGLAFERAYQAWLATTPGTPEAVEAARRMRETPQA